MSTKSNCFLLLIGFFSLNVFAQVDTTIYSFLRKKKIVGIQKIWKSSPNDWHAYFQYNDRGRGDSTVTHLHSNDKGLFTSMQVKGNDYYKNAYSESFNVSADSTVWEVNGQKKSAIFKNELYTGNNPAPGLYEPIIGYLLEQPEYSASIIPAGSIHLGKPIEIVLNKGRLHTLLVPVYQEPNPLPNYIWLTSDKHFFATVDPWGSIIKKGYEELADSLLTLQENQNQAYFSNELSQNSTILPHLIVFKNATVFQSASANIKSNMNIEVSNGFITAIYPASTPKVYKKTDSVIDCKGKFIMPGLWDMHGHYFKESGVMYIAGGVTHLRDMGNGKILLEQKKLIEENKLLGPDISYLSLLIDKADSFEAPTGEIINTLQEGFNAIDTYKKLGYQQLKLYSSIDTAWVKPLVDYAHKNKMKVAGHIPMYLNAEKCINMGFDEITHLNFVFLNFLGNNLGNLKSVARFTAAGERGGQIDLQSKPVQEFIALMKKKKVSLDPTLNVWDEMFNQFKGDTSHHLLPIVSWLPETWLANLSIQMPFANDSVKPAYKASFAKMLKMMKLLFDNGIFLVAGTDGGDAIALHHELELYVKAGIPSNEVLKIATYNAAKDCNLQNQYGQILVGRSADFIIIDGNPIKQIADIRRIETVIKNKRIYKPKQLLATQGWKYYY